MPGRISELDELAAPDAADQIEVLDISDTTMAPTGTNKRAPVSALGISTEDAVDAVAAALVDDPPITISYDDTANTVTVAVTTFGTSADGVVPASGGGTINFLRADGTWAAPPIFGGTGGHASFTFNSNTTEPIVGNQLRINNASQTAATRMWVSHTATNGMDVSIGLDKILAGHQIYFQDFDDASKWVKYTVTADGVNDGAYHDFAIVYHSGPANVPFQTVEFQAIAPGTVGVPPGGTAGQVLAKTSGTDYVVGWETPAPIRRTLNAQTGTTYTPVVADENQMVTLSNAAAITVSLPQNSAAAFPVGAEVDFLWLGVGQPTFAAGTGATVNATPGLKLRARYSAATAKKIATNDWVIIGDLAA